MVTEAEPALSLPKGEPILEELTQELERANQEILRLKGYAVPSASLRTWSTGLASSASAEGKAVRLRGIAPLHSPFSSPC